MKIHKLKFKNLNSLKGEWEIDFTDSAYKNDGLFAIIGPTGAGKSTILDAICLSLYGKTPRLNSITGSSNEIMNRASTDCFAQTTFACEQGVFRASFEQHYSRGNRNGNLVSPKVEVAEDDTGKVRANTTTQASKTVTELIGLTYEQFTRAVLLAQGQFKKFLDSSANDRSELLETITGTQMYSDISKKVFEQYAKEKSELEKLEFALGNIVILSEEQQKEKEEEAAKNKLEAETLNKNIEQLNKQLELLKNVTALKKESESIEREIAKNKNELKSFEPQRSQLLRDERAQKITAEYRDTERNKAALDSLDSKIASNENKIEKLKKKKDETAKAAQNEEILLKSAQSALDSQKPIIDKVKRYDAVIEEMKKNLKPEQELLNQLQRKFLQACRGARILPDNLTDNLSSDEIDSQISKLLHGNDISDTHKIINRFKELQLKWENLLDVKKTIIEHENSIDAFKKALEQSKQKIGELNKDKQRLESALKANEDYQKVVDDNIKLSTAILSLEEHRKRLVDGKPCPLCGAESHPFSLGVPKQSLSENEKALEAAKKQERQIRKDFNKTEKELAKTEEQKDQAEKSIKDLAQKIESLQNKSNEICKIGIGCDTDVCVKEIEFRIQRIKIKTSKTQECLNNAEKQSALKAPVQARDEFNRQNSKLKLKEEDLKQQMDERQKLFGTDDPEKRLEQLLNSVDKARNLRDAYKEETVAAEAELKSTIQILESQQEERKLKLKTYNDSVTDFNKKLAEKQFLSLNDFLASQLTEDLRERFQKQQKNLDEQKTLLEGKFTQVKEKLSALENTQLPDESEDELNLSCSNLKQQRDELIRNSGALDQQLSENKKNKKLFSQKQTELDLKKETVSRWKTLSDLIGSADGKKFRKIVQRISLEMLIDYANEQMAYLAPRYELTLQQDVGSLSDAEEKTNQNKKTSGGSSKDDLAIYCIDAWQGGVVRPTTNLSGGESFLVSLALALGLSKMSSQNKPLETLFLDEGFGTLDDETLQTALDAINQFQYSDDTNKLVGIISHVDALKERIANKIEVARTNSGTSSISGPGVTKKA